MAAIALNKFKTIRVGVTTNLVGIYTCPIGVASIVILCQASNVSASGTFSRITAVHSRSTETPSDYRFANGVKIPPNDGLNLVSDGRLALETSDVLKFSASLDNTIELILSVLETAKQ
jgi:hypothetical protein